MLVSSLVGRGPDVGEGDGGVEAVEDAEREEDVAEDRPDRVPVEGLARGLVAGALHLW